MPTEETIQHRPFPSHMRVFNLDELASTITEMNQAPSTFSPLGFLTLDRCAKFDVRKGELSLRKRKISSPTPSGMTFSASYFDAIELICDPLYCIEALSVSRKSNELERGVYWGDGTNIVESYLAEDGLRMAALRPLASWLDIFAKVILGDSNQNTEPLILPKNAYLMCQQFAHSRNTLEALTPHTLTHHLMQLNIEDNSQIELLRSGLADMGLLREEKGILTHPIWACLYADKNLQVTIQDEEGTIDEINFSGRPGNVIQIGFAPQDEPSLLSLRWPSSDYLRDEMLEVLQIPIEEDLPSNSITKPQP